MRKKEEEREEIGKEEAEGKNVVRWMKSDERDGVEARQMWRVKQEVGNGKLRETKAGEEIVRSEIVSIKVAMGENLT